jgi:hypothetical protein
MRIATETTCPCCDDSLSVDDEVGIVRGTSSDVFVCDYCAEILERDARSEAYYPRGTEHMFK